MKIKSNLRAGAGGASGAGHNSVNSTPDVVVIAPPPPPVVYYPVTRCAGI